MKNLIKKYWIYLALCVAWGVSGLALFGHFFWHKSYKQPTPVEDTTLINHSELKPLATANE